MENNLVDFLKNDLGVKTIYFCSGARNDSILKSLGDHFRLEFRLDERSATFEALGFMMDKGEPVAICTTSGTAVGECLPAMIEAFYHELPLIMISADRPQRLRTTHAPQAIDQTKIFSSFVRSKFSGELSQLKKIPHLYPMHLNLEIDDVQDSFQEGEVRLLTTKDINLFNKPLIFLSQGSNLSLADKKILDELPVYKFHECLSDVWFEDSEYLVKYEKTITKMIDEGIITSLIHFGKTPVAKLWRELEKKQISLPVINLGREKFGLSRGYFTQDKRQVFSHLSKIKADALVLETCIDQLLVDLPTSEVSVVNKILNDCERETYVFAGNSMPIRYVELIKRSDLKYFASRGANGIDGQISTAIGIAKSTENQVIAIIGDLTFLYDFTSLFNSIPRNLHIHVLDNDGGRIFERVDVDRRLINSPDISCRELVTNLNLSSNVTIHIIDNDETNVFWERWNS